LHTSTRFWLRGLRAAAGAGGVSMATDGVGGVSRNKEGGAAGDDDEGTEQASAGCITF
jgi:hypothetical protein